MSKKENKMYVIKKRQYYVRKSGSRYSYTTLLKNARVFSSREQAEKEKCGNEYVVSIYYELMGVI
jgi:hypothetical protein